MHCNVAKTRQIIRERLGFVWLKYILNYCCLEVEWGQGQGHPDPGHPDHPDPKPPNPGQILPTGSSKLVHFNKEIFSVPK